MNKLPLNTFCDLDQRRYFIVPQEKVDLYFIVLESQAIPYEILEQSHEDYLLRVAAHQGIAALDQLWLCERLEASRNEIPVAIEEQKFPFPLSPLLLSLCLSFVFFHYGYTNRDYQSLKDYIFSAQDILRGDYYRLLSALFLHADFWHYLSNLLSLYILSHLSNRRYGNGMNLIMILASAVLGNFFNLLYYWQENHFSVGASTAVFSCLGLLAGSRFVDKFPKKQPINLNFYQELVPLVSAFALLSMLGTGGENTDVSAHLFGLIAGLLIAIPYQILLAKKSSPINQS